MDVKGVSSGVAVGVEIGVALGEAVTASDFDGVCGVWLGKALAGAVGVLVTFGFGLVTRIVQYSFFFPTFAVILAVPFLIAFTTPFLETVAVFFFEDFQTTFFFVPFTFSFSVVRPEDSVFYNSVGFWLLPVFLPVQKRAEEDWRSKGPQWFLLHFFSS